MQWNELDTWTALTAALAAMSCALPGCYLLLRRQSMMGDALSHTALPGIVGAFLFYHSALDWGWLQESQLTLHTFALIGAVIAGLLTTSLTELVQKVGRVESSAALGVIYTSLFALGLLIISKYTEDVHLDADCVLFGDVERVVMNTVGDSDVPVAAVTNGAVLLINLVLVGVFFKELRISTFDPALAQSLGINSTVIHYLLMAVTSLTLVAAFHSVGSILVITVLVVPAATAYLLTNRLHFMVMIALGIGASSAFIGQFLAIVTPDICLSLGLENVRDTSMAGTTAVACGTIFVIALLFSPKKGVVSQSIRQLTLSFRIAKEDLLGLLYRQEEAPVGISAAINRTRWVDRLIHALAVWRLKKTQLITSDQRLTEAGREQAKQLVRSHRLWESYMAHHFPLADDHLHAAAHRVEHFLDAPILNEIEQELDAPGEDPHGRSIPPSS